MEQNENRKRIALLVDYDNFNQKDYFNILSDELDDIGEVIIGRAYFSNTEDKKIAEKFKDLELDPIYQIRFSTGKNAVDIRMSIEAIELLNKDYINSFCLATHDSDFTPLVKKLKENNKYVIGAGKDNVSKDFKNACDIFINVEQIYEANKTNGSKKQDTEITKEENGKLKTLIMLIDEIIEQIKESGDFVLLSRVSQLLYSKVKEFNPKNYGASNNKILPFFQKHLTKYYEIKKEKTCLLIKIINKRT
jgi:uncharacterized protein (TIGR00288 family)